MENLSIVDVNAFFEKIISGYTLFAHSASMLAAEIPSLSPDSIQYKCLRLNSERELLSGLDSQLIDILNFAHEDLATSAYISQYRNAFSMATLAVEDIQKQLFLIRDSFEEVTRH